MILRWIQSDSPTGKKTPAVSAPSTRIHRQRAKNANLDHVGESEFNAILEQVCDTVMPRKSAKPVPLHRLGTGASTYTSVGASKSTTTHGSEIPWSAMFQKLSEETASSLTDALLQLKEIGLLYPNVAPALAHVSDKVEHTKRIAMIAQQFSQLRGAFAPETYQRLSLRQVVSDAITQRARWLHKRRVKARIGLLDAQVHAHPATLHSLVDELINWAGGLAQDIGFAVQEQHDAHGSAQLLVIARVDTSSIDPAQWQNVGWYLWHQLAGTLGARADLQVTQEALAVTVDFSPPSDATAVHKEAPDSSLDTDMASVIAGCRVLLLMGDAHIHELAHTALNKLALQVSNCASLAQARILLGLSFIGTDTTARPLPHAIVYDKSVSAKDILALRQLLMSCHAEHRMAFVEISDQVGSDFHISQMGELSTAHVSVAAIPKSLAPALVFELCKVI